VKNDDFQKNHSSGVFTEGEERQRGKKGGAGGRMKGTSGRARWTWAWGERLKKGEERTECIKLNRGCFPYWVDVGGGRNKLAGVCRTIAEGKTGGT